MSVSKRRLSSIEDLKKAGFLPQDADERFGALVDRFAVGITNHVAQIITSDPSSDSVRKQYVPSLEELKTTSVEESDPIGDSAHSPVKGIVHRYPDRVLIKISNVCAVYCRYCFRREMIGPDSQFLSENDIELALDYIRNQKNIWEVILTGGDPLVLSARRLEALFKALEKIEHIQTLRIHTRVPLVSPDLINDTLCSVLKNTSKPIYMVIHVNHAQELTKDTEVALQKLRSAGCSLLSQTVLLRDVNNDASILDTLFRKLVLLHVKPYYLHHPDLVTGTAHFRVSIDEGQDIMRKLRGRLSGICLPSYVLDIPGGYGKIPIEYNYLASSHGGDSYIVEDVCGTHHDYPPKESLT